MRMLFVLTLLVLTGCGTSYHAKSLTGGYRGGWVSDRAMVVAFTGNNYTKVSRAGEYAMLRACELAIRRGFDKLGVVTAESQRIYQQHMVEPATVTQQTVGGAAQSPTYYPATFMSTSFPEGEVRAIALFPREVERFRDQGLTFIDTHDYVRQHASPELRDRIFNSELEDVMMGPGQ